jgi:trans-aconitate methyltransferase
MNGLPELERLESISVNSMYAAGPSSAMVEYSFEIFYRNSVNGNCLEMGPAEGVMTNKLVKVFDELTLVEGSRQFSSELAIRYPKIDVVHSLFEDFEPKKKFNNIVLGHVLEHVENPADILAKVKTWLAPQGKVFAAVPNARSLHRQAAVIMGLLKQEDDLNEMDIQHGHRRVFNPESFRGCFINSGLSVDFFGGYWIKPVSNKQIQDNWTPEMLHSFMKLGERYPDISAEIYVIASYGSG